MAVIFDRRFTPTSHSIHVSPVLFLDPDTVNIAAGIVLLSCIDISTSGFAATVLNLSFPVTSVNKGVNKCF